MLENLRNLMREGDEPAMMETCIMIDSDDDSEIGAPEMICSESEGEYEGEHDGDIEEVEDSDDEKTYPTGLPGCCNLNDCSSRGVFACDIVYPTGAFKASVEEEEFIDMEIILDSGAGAHVASKKHIPGCQIRESELKRAGACFVAIDGSRIENEGEAEINLLVKDGKGDGHNVRTTVQVADVTRALWSVGVLCDAGLDPRFKAEHAKVYDGKGIEVCHFERKNGLYVATVRLRNPKFQGFRRQGS